MRTYVILKRPEGTAGFLATTGGRLAVQAPPDDSVIACVYKTHTFHASGQQATNTWIQAHIGTEITEL